MQMFCLHFSPPFASNFSFVRIGGLSILVSANFHFFVSADLQSADIEYQDLQSA